MMRPPSSEQKPHARALRPDGAFTLVGLLVVVTIIVLLLALLLPSLNRSIALADFQLPTSLARL